ncbi:pentatricopeptide repeat-containing protein At4g16835, mitochondrial-like [Euphorbia lathyris]|uniref:pentatricopeptide repeat-containing protein At4g16835, mitochondrial-like n=1 Tax=Euphorbia lathyris TaxID=212925 RepID=UPI003313DDFA
MRILERAVRLKLSRQICSGYITANLNNLAVDGQLHQTSDLDNAGPSSGQNVQNQNISSFNKTLSFYVQNHQIEHAEELFDKMPLKDVVSWNTMLSAFSRSKNLLAVYKYFLEMQRFGIIPNEYTISIVLSAVVDINFNVLVPQIHAHLISIGLNSSVFVGSALVRAYASMGDQIAINRAFNEILVKDVTSWNALISSYMELGCMSEAQGVFDTMSERNVISWTILINGYIANKRINKARSMFNKMSERNVVSWTVMISGYVQNERFWDALKLFRLMVDSGTKPNQFTLSTVLDACAGCSCPLTGQQVHSLMLKVGVRDDVILLTSLVDMYGKCGYIDAAICVFESIKRKNVMSWNSIIGSYARHGLATQALEQFKRMISSGFRPDEVTFVNLLSACAHGGLVEQGEEYFQSMGPKYGINAELEHYTCMVDLYGRAGQIDEAEKVIKRMPFEPDVIVWGALLGACGLHSSLELGEFAAEGIHKLKRDHPAAYLMLSKIHGERGEWNGVMELRQLMKHRRIRNEKAGSWLQTYSNTYQPVV